MADRNMDDELFVDALEASPPSLEQIRHFLTADPGIARRMHACGYTAIDEPYGDRIATGDLDGDRILNWSPLMIACQKDVTEDILDFLIEQWPESVRFSCDGWRITALHLACHSQAPTNVVKKLLNLWPESASIVGYHGLPLHYCLLSHRDDQATVEIVKSLVKAYPKGVTSTHGNLPIHNATRIHGRRVDRFKIIKFLVDEAPETLLSYNDRGLLPIHNAVCHGSLKTVEYMVGVCPRSLSMKAKWNCGPPRLPLQEACRHGCCLDVFKYLLKKCPSDFDPTYLLHDVFEPRHFSDPVASVEIVKCLIQELPQSVKAKNFHGEIPLHAAANFMGSSDLHIRALLDAYPAGLFARRNDGETPFEIIESSPFRQISEAPTFAKEKMMTLLSSIFEEIAKDKNVPVDVLQLVLPFIIRV